MGGRRNQGLVLFQRTTAILGPLEVFQCVRRHLGTCKTPCTCPRIGHGFSFTIPCKTQTQEETNQIARTRFFKGRVMLRTHPLSAHPIILAPAPSTLGRPQRLPLCSSCSLIGPRPSSKRFHSRSIVFLMRREIPTTVPCDSGPVLGRTWT